MAIEDNKLIVFIYSIVGSRNELAEEHQRIE